VAVIDGQVPRRAGLAVFAVIACAALPGPARAANASWTRPVVAVSYYVSSDLPTIAKAIAAAKLPSGTPVYYGSYWGTAPRARRLRTEPSTIDVPGGRFAPIFGWTPNKFWEYRRLESADERRLRSDPHLDGAAPPLHTLLARGGSSAYRWGRELGRRFRDRVRQVEEIHDVDVDRWQFDEVPTNAVHRGGRKARDLVRGMLAGLTYGRPELGDRKVRGVVFVAHESLRLAAQPVRGELKRFWRTIDNDALAMVGEEYPRFVGNPRRSAFVQSEGQRVMARRGGVLRRLAAKYVVGVTPGYADAPGLGGNTGGRSNDGANAWRADFLAARAQYGVAGFAAYDMLGENGRSSTVRPLFRGFAVALRELGEER
jgi:hypothetical protein